MRQIESDEYSVNILHKALRRCSCVPSCAGRSKTQRQASAAEVFDRSAPTPSKKPSPLVASASSKVMPGTPETRRKISSDKWERERSSFPLRVLNLTVFKLVSAVMITRTPSIFGSTENRAGASPVNSLASIAGDAGALKTRLIGAGRMGAVSNLSTTIARKGLMVGN